MFFFLLNLNNTLNSLAQLVATGFFLNCSTQAIISYRAIVLKKIDQMDLDYFIFIFSLNSQLTLL